MEDEGVGVRAGAGVMIFSRGDEWIKIVYNTGLTP